MKHDIIQLFGTWKCPCQRLLFLIIVTFISDSQTLNGPISGLHLGDKHCGTMEIKYAD